MFTRTEQLASLQQACKRLAKLLQACSGLVNSISQAFKKNLRLSALMRFTAFSSYALVRLCNTYTNEAEVNRKKLKSQAKSPQNGQFTF